MGRMVTPTFSKPVRTWLSDMDGVLVHEEAAIPGAAEFVTQLQERGRPFLLLTNNSIYTPRDLRARLRRSGIDVPEEAI
jgi:NagD protein